MNKVDLACLAKEDAFKLIGGDWMLVCAGKKDRFNMMTASWGGIGWLWNRPVAFVFIRPERYTHEFVEAEERQAFRSSRKSGGRRSNSVAPRVDGILTSARKPDCPPLNLNQAWSRLERLV